MHSIMFSRRVFALLVAASAALAGPFYAAADSLYEQQRLERSVRQREFDLQLRSDIRRQGITDPVRDQRARDRTYRQQLRLDELLQRQKRQLRQADTATEQQLEQQRLERERRAQELDFKIEQDKRP